MPKENQRLTGRHEYTAEEIAAQDEKFRTFFTTTVAQVPEEMTRRTASWISSPRDCWPGCSIGKDLLPRTQTPVRTIPVSCCWGVSQRSRKRIWNWSIQPEAQPEIKMPRQSAPIKKKDVAPAVRAVSVPKLDPEPDPEPVPMPEPDPEPIPHAGT